MFHCRILNKYIMYCAVIILCSNRFYCEEKENFMSKVRTDIGTQGLQYERSANHLSHVDFVNNAFILETILMLLQ